MSVCVCHSKLAHIRLSYSEDKLPNNSVAHHIGRLVRGGRGANSHMHTVQTEVIIYKNPEESPPLIHH